VTVKLSEHCVYRININLARLKGTVCEAKKTYKPQ